MYYLFNLLLLYVMIVILYHIQIAKCNSSLYPKKCNTLEKILHPLEDCQEFKNPDEYLNTPQLIRRHGYPAETHIVETEDGYLLALHRIPGSKSGKIGTQPIFLQHGLLSSSSDWVDAGNKSLGFMLADLGYDVWLGNARGNIYSKAHVSISVESAKFWNFSWHEMGVYDLPAALYHIAKTTEKGGDILYVGHSMGTTMFFVLSSIKPEVAKLVRFMVALAPVSYMTHIRSPIRYLTPWAYDFEWIANYLGVNQFLPHNKILKFLAYDCELFNVDKKICEDIIFVLCGFDKKEFNEEILPVVLAHIPAGTSTKTVIHYAQEIKNGGGFRKFDYGPQGNKIKYGSPNPPLYKLEKIKVPTYLMYALNDWLAGPIDVTLLARNLTRNQGLYQIKYETFNHVDFLFGKDAPELVYKPLIESLQNYTKVY